MKFSLLSSMFNFLFINGVLCLSPATLSLAKAPLYTQMLQLCK